MLGLKYRQVLIFLTTYFCVVCRRASLESWSLLKAGFQKESHIPISFIGGYDACYLITYAFGEIINGRLSDKFKANKVVGMGLLGASLSLLLMSILGQASIFNPYLFFLLWSIEGYSQSAVYPGCIKIMSKESFSSSRGRMMGLWSSSLNVGNILGAIMTTGLVVGEGTSWELIIFVISCMMIFPALALLNQKMTVSEPLLEEHKPSFIQTLRIKGVALYAIGYSCVKMMNYSFMMWLPLYLEFCGVQRMSIGLIMVTYQLCGAAGAFTVGWITDLFKNRVSTLITLLLIALPNTAVLLMSTNIWILCIVSMIAGFCNIGISATVLGQVSIDLGKKNVGAVSGILDGCASLVAGLGMVVIGILQEYNWEYSWGMVGLLNVMALGPFLFLKYSNQLFVYQQNGVLRFD